MLVITRILYGYQKHLVNTINAIDRPEVGFRFNAKFILTNLFFNAVIT